jgi:hypothetical protein
MFPPPTQITLAVTMKELDIQRNSDFYLDQFPSETYDQSVRRALGRLAGAVKSVFGQSNKVEGQSSSGSMA